jgi:hypothetical protein
MSGPPEHADEHFRPLRPAKGVRLVTAIVLGPLIWLLAFVITSWVLENTNAIEFGVIVAVGSFLGGVLVLIALRAGRDRERRRYERG